MSCALLLSAAGGAAVDHAGLGDGHNGALLVGKPGTIVNAYALVARGLDAGETSIETTGSAGLEAGDLVLLFQATVVDPGLDAGTSEPIDPSELGLAPLEYARVKGVSGTTVQLEEPLVYAHPAEHTQLVVVPEYTDVTVSDAGALVPRSWDGAVGGVLAFFARGTVRVDGRVSADGSGLRGGQVAGGNLTVGCVELDGPAPPNGSRGEGLIAGRFRETAGGRGNLANAGWGAPCPQAATRHAGGAGGGGVGRGGNGGSSSRTIVALGGSPLRFDPWSRACLGGGGGAGSYDSGGWRGLRGGAGGGVVLIRAARVEGVGTISANGAPGAAATLQNSGAAGGGAGGSVVVRASAAVEVREILARGGEGGLGEESYPAGGGGGGGSIAVQAATFSSAASAEAGRGGPGIYPGLPENALDATARGAVSLVQGGYEAPPVPVVEVPRPGDTVSDARPVFEGSAAVDAGVRVHIDGVVVEEVSASQSGRWLVASPVALAPGPHVVQASAHWLGASSQPSSPTLFFVPTLPIPAAPTTKPQALTVGCGCATGAAPRGGVPSAMYLVLAWLGTRRRGRGGWPRLRLLRTRMAAADRASSPTPVESAEPSFALPLSATRS